jgi:squalene monooxygenase
LENLGLRECLEGIDSIPVEGYYVSYFKDPVTIPYPKPTPTSPPPEGRCFHHGRFVMKLREAAMACPNVSVVETKATDLVTCSHTQQVLGVECTSKDNVRACYFGHLTVVADGYASKFRKQHHPHTPKVRSRFWGLELIDTKLPKPYYGHVLLSDNAPILLYQIGTHETRILVDIPENLPSASVKNGGVKSHMRNVVLPSLPESVQPAFIAALEQGQLRSMPNSFLPAAANKTPGLVILGDALNMRHPLTGGGMTVAFNDVGTLRDLLSPEKVPNLGDTKRVMKQLSNFHWERKKSASVINILAQALYALFAANGAFISPILPPSPILPRSLTTELKRTNIPPTDQYLRALQRGCFRYFQLGLIDGPAGLLGGLIKKPSVLFVHFFSVALLSLWVLLREYPPYLFPVALFKCIMTFWTACVVIFPYMLIEAFC